MRWICLISNIRKVLDDALCRDHRFISGLEVLAAARFRFNKHRFVKFVFVRYPYYLKMFNGFFLFLLFGAKK